MKDEIALLDEKIQRFKETRSEETLHEICSIVLNLRDTQEHQRILSRLAL